jgi:hypothetical protein
MRRIPGLRISKAFNARFSAGAQRLPGTINKIRRIKIIWHPIRM